ncbi:nucleotidyltransferase domain-containing protein [Burkholderia multivorans]|uniref:nucleotidyltransferase domain-containing protein n=1 Tax=Burkholderia multivorans TaxID=87883 RepID=UPI0013DF58C7|nr:nucleotidyltransferase domain-containing protein [Burkholderia multivorans]MBU9617152.1 helix-turn-helix domain-containing protein [Burkholderia multivorans]NGM76170.1 helix-turn-helix domain-containing protein [Burkholderia multivorans]
MLRSIASTLFSDYRRRVLGLLLLRPDEALHVREIARMTDTAPGTLHKELSKLAEAGILSRERQGNQVLYRANRGCAIYEELAAIMRKTSGIGDVLTDALRPCAGQIDVAFIFGSVARGQETADSDVDVMVIGTVGFANVVRLLYDVQATLRRDINPKVLSRDEFRQGVDGRDAFLRDVLGKPKIFLIGTEDDLAELAGH